MRFSPKAPGQRSRPRTASHQACLGGVRIDGLVRAAVDPVTTTVSRRRDRRASPRVRSTGRLSMPLHHGRPRRSPMILRSPTFTARTTPMRRTLVGAPRRPPRSAPLGRRELGIALVGGARRARTSGCRMRRAPRSTTSASATTAADTYSGADAPMSSESLPARNGEIAPPVKRMKFVAAAASAGSVWLTPNSRFESSELPMPSGRPRR